MKHNNYKSKKRTPYFYYPQDEDTYYLISYEEVNKIKDREDAEPIFTNLRMSFSEEEAKKNYKKVEKFILDSMKAKEKKEFSRYSNIRGERILESSIEDKYWVSAMLDVWSLNCDKSNFEIKIGHKLKDGYSILMYRKKGGILKDKIVKMLGAREYQEIKINMYNISLTESCSFACGKYSYSIGGDILEVRKRDSGSNQLVIELGAGNIYGKKNI